MTNNTHDNIIGLIENISDKIVTQPTCADLYYQRGKLFWKIGDKAAAMTDFNSAVSFDKNSPAKMYLEMANDIMDFYNTDLYNP